MCNCRPLYKVKSVAVTAGVVTLTVNRHFADIGQNALFRLCLPGGLLPEGNTGQVVITDGVLTFAAFNWRGDYLRADSLRRFICERCRLESGGRRCREGCCLSVTLDAFRGGDPAHITVFNRMCPSHHQP